MLIKVLSAFLVIQFFSFALWQGVRAWNKSEPVIVTNEVSIQHEAAQSNLTHVRFSAKIKDEGFQKVNPDKKQEIVSVLEKLPINHTSALKNIVLDYDPKAHRGLGGKSIIILRGINIDPEEFTAVMVHEIGHNVDLGYLSELDKAKQSEFMDGKKPVYEGDPSLDFYRISWEDDKTRKKTASNLDFVSGYAMTDPFEDFAESYVYYILHNKDFKSKTQTSEQLLKKYQFIKNNVFNGKEFDTGEYLTDRLNNRPWDITILSYNLDEFLRS